MLSQDLMNKESQYLMDTYARYPVVLEKGCGATVYDVEGKEYIDFGSGIGVNCLGYGDEGLAKAVYHQAKNFMHISNLYYHPLMIELAEKLTKRTAMSKVFFSNSGAEANEGAIKLARKYSFSKYGKERTNIITLKNSFHGRTITTLSATGQDVFHNYFFPFTEGFQFATANEINAVKELLDNSICGIMIELVQGEGGVLPLDKAFVNEVVKLCAENDILLIVDEIQTGVGRTGKFLCSEHYDIKPDIITLAKGLGGGLPIGAVLCNEKCEKVFEKSSHGSTFGANPVCCAAALEVLNRIDDAFLNEVMKKSEYIKNELLKNDKIKEIRGLGLMMGFDIEGIDAKALTVTLAQKGLLALTAKTAVRFLPPLVISYEEIDKGLKILMNELETVE